MLPAGKCEKFLYQHSRLLCCTQPCGCHSLRPFILSGSPFKRLQSADDGGKYIVEVVRYAAGKLADRLHLLALRQLHFECPVFRGFHRIDDRLPHIT
jgi:hypothetical protein